MANQVNPCHDNCINPWNYEGSSEAKGIAVAIVFFSAFAVAVSLTSTLVSFGVHIQGLNALSVLSIYGKIGVISGAIVSLAIFAIAITWLITKTCCRPNFVNVDHSDGPPHQPGRLNLRRPRREQRINPIILSNNLPLLNADNIFSKLPCVLRTYIFSFLNIKEKISFASSCKIFNKYTNQYNLWKNEIKILEIEDFEDLKSKNSLALTINQEINVLKKRKDKTACRILEELFSFDLEKDK